MIKLSALKVKVKWSGAAFTLAKTGQDQGLRSKA